MTFRGEVIRQPYATGTKSARAAIMLATGEGNYLLRRVGANPYEDAELDELVGQKIVCEGIVHRDTLLMSTWKTAD